MYVEESFGIILDMGYGSVKLLLGQSLSYSNVESKPKAW